MTAGLQVMKNILTPSAKSVLILLGLTAAALATHAVIQKYWWIRYNSMNDSKGNNEIYYENSQITWWIRITNKRN